MFKILILLLSISPTISLGDVDCSEHRVYCKIKELRPKIDDKRAMQLSNILYGYAKKYGGDPILAVAIGMQETSLREKDRKQNSIEFFRTCSGGRCYEDWRVISTITDVCMFQFHVDTIVNYGMDPIRLRDDLSYCVEWHFKLMSQKIKECKDLRGEAWSCYHSRTKKHREMYIRDVERYLD